MNLKTAVEFLKEINDFEKLDALKLAIDCMEKAIERRKKLEIPEWLDIDAFESFVKMRTAKKKPMTKRAQKMLINKLRKMRDNGFDPNKVLDRSNYAAWLDVYEPKGDDIPKYKAAPTMPDADEIRVATNRGDKVTLYNRGGRYCDKSGDPYSLQFIKGKGEIWIKDA